MTEPIGGDRIAETTEERLAGIAAATKQDARDGRHGRSSVGSDDVIWLLARLDAVTKELKEAEGSAELATECESAALARAEAAEADAEKLAQALEQIVGFEIDDNASGAWHFAEVRAIARAALAARSK